MNAIFRILGKGIMVILPFAVVVWLLFFLFGILEGMWILILDMVHFIVKKIANENLDTTLPSIVVSVGLLLVMFAIILYIGYKFEKRQNAIFVKLGEWVLSKIPVMGSVYYTIKDLVSMIGGSSKDKYLGVAYVTIGEGDILGFITKEEGEYFWVFCPLTPPTSGLLLRIHKDKLKKSSMSVSDGLKKVVSFGMK
ncbi:MAG: DUF502 domain-containing protein [Helicobacter sp.]|uniref:DUF502 domain-containing protein n=1 Tax=Helicobacter TaxID=209 RepID=UPI0026EB6528|nr:MULTISPECIES: DUF502 domain-containing protein [Helicobacter]MCI7410769.1 DUF502 domain-containing protein [Helicobacter bilis]MDD7296050.1 DUF502 domain-containing protein [Helicobacter bilis]MDY4399416.1 DUF502 domain-containing protein [Helicobacter bilis]MDY5823140.1 DUF502 domain-containing protein [Helicobacter sp.]